MNKKIVCRCEDLTYTDIVNAINAGYTDMESLKRFTGFGTGPCQGKGCMLVVLKILEEKTGKHSDITTIRPPLLPVFLGVFENDTEQ